MPSTWCGVLIATGLACMSASAARGQMYSDALLAGKQSRIEQTISDLVARDIPASAPPAYRAAAARAKAGLRRRGIDFLDFHHNGNLVSVPVDAMQFLDDLALVRAWLDLRDCDGSTLPNYVFRNTPAGLGGAVGPVETFGIDRARALAEPGVDNVSGVYYYTAVWFLLAHEIGHIALGHVGQSIENEIAADDFAIETMRRKHLLPAGTILYFTALSLADEANAVTVHPVSAARLRKVADAVQRSPQDFAEPGSASPDRTRGRVVKIAGELSGLADALQAILVSEGKIGAAGASIADVRRQCVFPKVDYKSACAVQRRPMPWPSPACRQAISPR